MKKANAVVALGALAQETRLDIFRLLVQRGPEGMPAGEIGERLKQPSPTMSFHLNQLRYAGLVSSRRESRSIIYSAKFKTMNELLGYLTENCCGGQPELCGPERFPANACAPGSSAPTVSGSAVMRSPSASATNLRKSRTRTKDRRPRSMRQVR
jgi:DNA-binding transcriptional ArsR family regulator